MTRFWFHDHVRRRRHAFDRSAAALMLVATLAAGPATPLAQSGSNTHRTKPPTITGEVRHAGGVIRLTYEPTAFDVTTADMLEWVRRSAAAVSVYFGRFPVTEAEVAIKPRTGAIAVGGRAWSEHVPSIRMTLNRRIGRRDLMADSVLVHEMTHLAIPDLLERHLWLHEGIATYVEFVARAQAGQSSPRQVWEEFLREMPAGLVPERNRGGLDGATSTDRVYWGGALFCLLADIEIRKQTGNRQGLQDGLRALQAAGGDLSKTWSLPRILATADTATGTTAMRRLYRALGSSTSDIDLAETWRQLGIIETRRGVSFDDRAPLAHIRLAIMSRPSLPILVSAPALLRVSRRPHVRLMHGQMYPAYASPSPGDSVGTLKGSDVPPAGRWAQPATGRMFDPLDRK